MTLQQSTVSMSVPQNGEVNLTDRPGLGIDLDEAKVEEFRLT